MFNELPPSDCPPLPRRRIHTQWYFTSLLLLPPNQMVNIRRISGSRNPAEMTYYVQHNGVPLAGASAAKVLNTVDSQTMALTLGYFVQLQAERKHSALLSFDEWARRQNH